MPNAEVNKRDHNYSEAAQLSPLSPLTSLSRVSIDGDVVGQIKNINELKKIAPRVRLQDTKSLNELTKISLSNNKSHSELTIRDRTRQELKKYCRTCAGLKLPLVKIFLYHSLFLGDSTVLWETKSKY